MLSKLLKSRRRAVSEPAVPDGTRIYAVGDVHGRADLLDALLAMIDADDTARAPADTTIIFLGDLVDRGPDSAGVVDRLHRLAASGAAVRFIAGNHEEVFLGALRLEDRFLRTFCRIGGRETALSYGLDARTYERADYPALGNYLGEHVPSDHRTFLESFENMIVIGDYAFVHAGVRPGLDLDQQRVADLRWIRDPFLDHRGSLGKRIVHGHTIAPAVEFRPHRIGIDTGAYATGRLTALMLEGTSTFVLHT